MTTDAKTKSFYARVVAFGAGLALLAGLVTNSRTVYDAVCRFLPWCSSSPYHFRQEIHKFSQAAQLRDRLSSMAGKVGYFDLRILEPVFDSHRSLEDESSDDGQLCVRLFEDAPGDHLTASTFTTYCAPSSDNSASMFGPEKAYVFVWNGYYSVSTPQHMGQSFYEIRLTPLAAEVAIPTLKQQ